MKDVRATETTLREKVHNNILQTGFDTSKAMHESRKPSKRIRQLFGINYFIMRPYYKGTNLEPEMGAYQYAFHDAFIYKFSHLY